MFHALLKSLGIILNKNDYLWMTKSKMFFLSDPWFHSEVQGNSLATFFGLNCTLWKERLFERNTILIGAKFVKAFLKDNIHRPS